MEKNIKFYIIGFSILIIIGFTYMIYYIDKQNDIAMNIDIEQEIQKIEEKEEEKIENVVEKVEDKYDLIAEQGYTGDEFIVHSNIDEALSQEKLTIGDKLLPKNNINKEFTELLRERYQNDLLNHIKNKEFIEASKLANTLVSQYDFSNESEDFVKFIADMRLVYIFDEESEVSNKMVTINEIYTPEIYAYLFFLFSIDEQSKKILDINSIIPPIKSSEFELTSIEEVIPRTIGIDEFYLVASNLNTYKLVFNTNEGVINFYIIKEENGKLVAFKFESDDNRFSTTYRLYNEVYN